MITPHNIPLIKKANENSQVATLAMALVTISLSDIENASPNRYPAIKLTINIINKSEKKGCIKIEVKEDVAYLTTKTEDGDVNEKITIGLKGKDILIGFNPKYLLDCLHATTDSFVKLYFTSSTAPGIIKGEDESWLYLILPLRISA